MACHSQPNKKPLFPSNHWDPVASVTKVGDRNGDAMETDSIKARLYGNKTCEVDLDIAETKADGTEDTEARDGCDFNAT
jgi:hypothetical protein